MKILVIGLVALTMVIAGAIGASAELDLNRLLLYWPCDEGAGDILEDASGNGFDAQIAGGHKWEEGRFGGAVSLQNTSATAVGEVVASTADTGEITLAAWVFLRNHGAYSGVISVAHPSCGASCCYRLLISPSLNPFWNGGEHNDKSAGNVSLELETWYHYALTVDGTDRVYINGELVAEVPGIDPPEFDEVSVYLGAGEGPATHMIEDGIFDEAMIWDVALDEDQIGELIDGGYLAVQPVGKLAITWGKVKQ